GAAPEFDQWHEPLINADCRNLELPKFAGEQAVTIAVEELVVSRQHEEQADGNAIEHQCRSRPTGTVEHKLQQDRLTLGRKPGHIISLSIAPNGRFATGSPLNFGVAEAGRRQERDTNG